MTAISQQDFAESVTIRLDEVSLQGDLQLPFAALGLVVFAHGSGSSRKSPRNQSVAKVLNRAGLGTLLLDLLSREEEQMDERTGHLRFNIELLAQRVFEAVRWAIEDRHIDLPIGLFGSSTGAAAALVAAAKAPMEVRAVVSRGGRPDLAGPMLHQVECPTLLIVGALDQGVIQLNQAAYEKLNCTKSMETISGATHLFAENGALEEVAHRARDWFARFLTPI